MSDTFKNEDKAGGLLVQVQNDLRQLKCSLKKLTISEVGKTLDIEELDTAIHKAENRIKKHAEEYLTKVNNQVLVLPSIQDVDKKRAHIPKWKPVLETLPDVYSQGKDLPGSSPREKHKPALTLCLLRNAAHPNKRTIMHRKSGAPVSDVHRRSKDKVKHKILTGPMVQIHTIELKRHHRQIDKESMEKGVSSSSSFMCSLIQHKAASLHPREDFYSSKNMGLTSSKSRCPKQLKWETEPEFTRERTGRESIPPKTPPPSATSKSIENMEGSNCLITKKPQQNLSVQVPVNISKYTFTIVKGQINPVETDFCRFKQSFSLCWRNVVDTLEALKKLLRDFAVPLAEVSGERLVEFSQGWSSEWRRPPPVMSLLSVLENWEEVLDLVSRPGQRFKGEGGIEAAAIHIQSCWRRYVARTAYLSHYRRKWAVRTIAISWLVHTQMCGVRKALQARRSRQLENYRSRAQHLAANWKHIQSSKRTIIHIPSLGYSQSQRQRLKNIDILQNMQIGRLCDVRDKNVDVIYVSPLHLEDDILHYYTRLQRCDGAAESDHSGGTETPSYTRRFIILTPEAVDYFPIHNMSLSSLLKYSPRTLKRIKNLIQGKQAYIVGGVAHVDDLAVADELGVPILGPEPAVAQLYSTKSGGRRILTGAEVDVPPGQGDIYSLNQLHEALAELMTQNINVQRWLFKIGSEHGDCGTAYCDVCHISCNNWALQEYRRHGPELWKKTKWIQESVLNRYLNEVPEWLARYARPAKTSCYPNWACFLKTFLGQGGVVEAYPPSDSVTCLTVDLLLEPGGEVTMLSCGDQLRSSCQLEAAGSSVPQTSVNPETLHSICMRVGQACLRRLIIGHVSVELATFLNHSTMEQKVWAIDLNLTCSDQLAMTQMLLMMTGGTLNCRTSSLEVPVPVREKSCEGKTAAKACVVNRYAAISSNLFHSNLPMLYHNVLFMMCKAHGIGYDVKRKLGTIFALYDNSERSRIGMITVSEDLQGALLTFAQNLSVIHQEISQSKMQGETNFKELIKDIKDILQMTVQNKLRAAADKTTA